MLFVASYQTIEDTRLVDLARDGDRRAFGELVDRHQAAVYRVCYRVLWHAEDAADTTQDTFIRAFDKLDTFQQRSSFKTWLTRIAVNLAINARSRQDNAATWDGLLPGAAPSAEDMVVQAETMQQVHLALRQLPVNHRVAVVLRDLEGYSYRDVAEALDVPEGTAKGWAHRGRQRLKELLT